MTSHKVEPDEQSAQSKAILLIRVFIAILLLAAAVTAILKIDSSSQRVPAAFGGRRGNASPATHLASASPRNGHVPTTDDEARQLVVGIWQDNYQGQRTLTVRSDGTATMVVEFDGWKARLFTPRLQIETTWAIEAGRFNRRTVGGEPADKVEFVKNRVGDTASDKIVRVAADRMLLIDQDGQTQYDWRRLR
jgi:hypothetical protein